MSQSVGKRFLWVAGIALGLWLAARYLLPIALPFLLGTALALMAEPAVRLGANKLHLPRWLSAGIGVSLTLVFVVGILSLLAGILLRQLGDLARQMPNVQQMADDGISLLRERLLAFSAQLPESLGTLVSTSVQELQGGSALVEQVTRQVPGFLAGLLDLVSSGALVLGTGIIAAFLISSRLPKLREKCGDRAVLRAIHEFQDNRRVLQQVEALESGSFDEFLRLIKESGISSWIYLQNVVPAGYTAHQDVAVALALCEKYLEGRGAYRVHGGGFAGTVQAFVPYDLLDSFKAGMDAALGEGACHVLSIRPQGGVEMEVAK